MTSRNLDQTWTLEELTDLAIVLQSVTDRLRDEMQAMNRANVERYNERVDMKDFGEWLEQQNFHDLRGLNGVAQINVTDRVKELEG
jgi:hypothetical protein